MPAEPPAWMNKSPHSVPTQGADLSSHSFLLGKVRKTPHHQAHPQHHVRERMKLLNAVHDENPEDHHDVELDCQRDLLKEALLNSVLGRNLEDLAAQPTRHDH